MNIFLSADQHYDVTRQLDDGIRLLQSQGHNPLLSVPGNIELCHTSCELFGPYGIELIEGTTEDHCCPIYKKSKHGWMEIPMKVIHCYRRYTDL